MDFYEMLVHEYLTQVKYLAAIPQCGVYFKKNGNCEPCLRKDADGKSFAVPDFLAFDVKNHQVQIVEVNGSVYMNRLAALARRCSRKREKVECWVRWFVGDGFK